MNSRSVKAGAAQSVVQSLATAYSTTAMSPELCHIIVVGSKNPDTMSEEQHAQLYMWLTSWFRLVELAYFHYKVGFVAKVDTSKPTLDCFAYYYEKDRTALSPLTIRSFHKPIFF